MKRLADAIITQEVKEGHPVPGAGPAFLSAITAAASIGPCPASAKSTAAAAYRGTATPLKPDFPETQVILCDDAANHSDGIHLLRFGGDIEWAAKGTPAYEDALKSTLPAADK